MLAAALAQVSNHTTVLGAELFFWSRLVHAALYLVGVPMIRSLVFGVGVAGILMILRVLLHLI